MSTNVENTSSASMTQNCLLPAVDDAIKFIADSLGEETKLRQMIDLWCIDQLGNTDEALAKADAMFTAARDIFYGSTNGR